MTEESYIPTSSGLGCGPVQIENEFGFIGPNVPYLKELLRIARANLGEDVIIYTTDPPPRLANGTIPGPDVYTWVTPAHGNVCTCMCDLVGR